MQVKQLELLRGGGCCLQPLVGAAGPEHPPGENEARLPSVTDLQYTPLI